MIKKVIFTVVMLSAASALFAYENNKPENHDGSWMALHGGESLADRGLCLSCHTDGGDCVMCHQEMAPRNHNMTWKGRVHGIKARWDRETCMACHKQDSCVECHSYSRPSSHRPGWGGLGERLDGQRHCKSCHYPLRDNSCFTCHETVHTPSKYQQYQ